MSKPKYIYICGRKWEVVFKPSVLDEGTEQSGVTTSKKQVIEVSTEGCEDHRCATLWHEILHSSLSTVANDHPKEEEQCVQAQETGTFSFFRDKRNKWAIDLIIYGED